MDQPFTFDDLDQLIEKSVTTLDDFHDIFINQSESLNHTYLVVDKNYEKIKTISSELNRLNYMNLQIQREIENTDIFMASVEERIMQLESCQHAISNKSNVDVNRENIYGLTENINCCLVNCKEEVELRQPHESLSFPNSPFEQLVQIMINLLENLENVEMSIETLKITYIGFIRETKF